MTGTSLAFAWNAASCGDTDTCSSIRSYPYRLIDVETGAVINGETTGTSVTIPNLEPCTSYGFGVAAMSGRGITGMYSDSLNATTSTTGKRFHIHRVQNYFCLLNVLKKRTL